MMRNSQNSLESTYNRYDPELLSEIDVDRYSNELYYRSQCDTLRQQSNRLFPEIKKQEIRVMTKMESLVDTDLLMKMMQDPEYDWVVKQNRRKRKPAN